MMFLLGSDSSRCGKMIEELENSYLHGTNHYPNNIKSAFNLLVNWKYNPRLHLIPLSKPSVGSEVAFNQNSKVSFSEDERIDKDQDDSVDKNKHRKNGNNVKSQNVSVT